MRTQYILKKKLLEILQKIPSPNPFNERLLFCVYILPWRQ